MSVFVNRKVSIPESEWRECQTCNGTGVISHAPSEQIPFPTKDECPNPMCVDGTVKFADRRVSQRADQDATERLIRQRYGNQ